MRSCTVAIPVFNRRELVGKALESALAQRVDGLEIVIVDNCSTDGTWELLRSYSDPRIRLHRNERNIGLFPNFNRCLELSDSRYIRFLCSDDRLLPDCLRGEIEIMERNPDCVLLCTRGRRVNMKGDVIGMQAAQFPAGVYPGEQAVIGTLWVLANYGVNPLNYPSGMLIRRDRIGDGLRFRTDWRMAADVDYFFGALRWGNLAVSDQIGCDITVHPGQEGAGVALSQPFLKEVEALAEQNVALLTEVHRARQVRHQLAALFVAFALRKWRSAPRELVHEYLASGVRLAEGVAGCIVPLAKLAAFRLARRVFGHEYIPLQPVRSL